MDNGDFWVEMGGAFVGQHGSVNDFLGDMPKRVAMRALTDRERQRNALPSDTIAGTRVRFVANLGSVLTYPNPPDTSVHGTVVTVKTANGPQTMWEGRVFVAWDDGEFRPILAEHLRLSDQSRKVANSVRRVVADLGDLSAMFATASSGDELIHRATRDLWAVKKEGGTFVIERLFKDTGAPLKV